MPAKTLSSSAYSRLQNLLGPKRVPTGPWIQSSNRETVVRTKTVGTRSQYRRLLFVQQARASVARSREEACLSSWSLINHRPTVADSIFTSNTYSGTNSPITFASRFRESLKVTLPAPINGNCGSLAKIGNGLLLSDIAMAPATFAM